MCASKVPTASECLDIIIFILKKKTKKNDKLVDLINNAGVKSMEGGSVQSAAAVIVAGVNASAGADG